jgi:deoxycytidylate deaminase
MRFLEGEEEKEARRYMMVAAEVAKNAKCLRSKCGSIIVKNNEIIGRGHNSPPGDIMPEKCIKEDLPEDFISDRTCCIHAEDRAIREALRNNPGKIQGAKIYFIRLDLNNNLIKAGEPYCTWCSKTALDEKLSEFVLWHEKGICAYETKEYNQISYKLMKTGMF